MIKKILYIGFQYDYGIEKNGYAINYKAWYEGFIKLGYEVEAVFYDNYSKGELQEEVIKKAKNFNPDLIFCILQSTQIKVLTLEVLQKHKFFTVNLFGDDHWRFDEFSSKYANYFNACITTDKFSIGEYKLIGQKNIIKSEWASLESSIEYEKVKYLYDVSFVGGESSYRRWFVNELGARGIKVHCFGDRWDNGRVSYEEMEKIFSVTRINLNISNSIQYDIRYLMASPRNILNTLRGKKNKSQVKARVFEIPAQGGFELAEYVPCIEDYFDLGKEIVCYKDVDEAALLINHYLSNSLERESIKRAGVLKARQQHTYIHRIKDFMKDIAIFHEAESNV